MTDIKWFAALLLESSPLTPFWNNWFLGFCIVDVDGSVVLTRSGHAFLDWVEVAHADALVLVETTS